jgi:hypothetical protein
VQGTVSPFDAGVVLKCTHDVDIHPPFLDGISIIAHWKTGYYISMLRDRFILNSWLYTDMLNSYTDDFN